VGKITTKWSHLTPSESDNAGENPRARGSAVWIL
jgi:hypothetical protein